MSARPKESPSKQVGSKSDSSSLDEAVYRCTCGTPDASGNWICCDSDDCPVGWYHWECVWVTEEPSGDWLCPRCSQKSTKNAELLKKRRGAKMLMFPKLGKTAVTDLNKSLDRESKMGHAVTGKAHMRAKKGIAVKKALPKKKPKWIVWAETTSEGEEEHKESVHAAQEAVVVAKGRQKKARVNQSKERLTRSWTLRGTSKLAAGVKKEARTESEEESEDFIEGERNENFQNSNGELSDGRKESSGDLFDVPKDLDELGTDHSEDVFLDEASGIEEDPARKADPNDPYDYRHFLEPVPRLPRRTPTNAMGVSTPLSGVSAKAANSTTPAVGSQAMYSPPSALPESSKDSTLAITVRHPSEVPSTPPASGAAMVIDTEEQGWTPIITSVAPDGSNSVDYWSYRTNTWCTIPLSAIRSTLPRLL